MSISPPSNQALLRAIRQGDPCAVRAAIAAGDDVTLAVSLAFPFAEDLLIHTVCFAPVEKVGLP